MAKVQASDLWNEAAVQILAEEARRITKHEAGTREGKDPEHLHQMRVGLRRLRSALRLFESDLKLPKPLRRKSLAPLAAVLGEVRDLDVLIAALLERYRPLLPPDEQEALDRLVSYLERKREQARREMLQSLDGPQYAEFERASAAFFASPRFRGRSGAESLYHRLPGLLAGALVDLWKHPGWQEPDIETLHDLRIAVKRVRYSIEFFLPCYGRAARSLHAELKRLQGELGTIHDCDVLLGQLTAEATGEPTPWQQPFAKLTTAVRTERRTALRRFRRLRTRLLDERTRSAAEACLRWPGTPDDRELFEQNHLPAGALVVERRYRLAEATTVGERLGEWRFRPTDPTRHTDHYLEVLGPQQYLRLRRTESGRQVTHRITRRDHGPEGSYRVEEEDITALVYRAFLARFHQLPVPVIATVSTRWHGFFAGVPLTVELERIEGIGPQSGDYLSVLALVPDAVLLDAAGAALEAFCQALALTDASRLYQSDVGLLLGWLTSQQLVGTTLRLSGAS